MNILPIKSVEYDHPVGGASCTAQAWARAPATPSAEERIVLKERIKRLLRGYPLFWRHDLLPFFSHKTLYAVRDRRPLHLRSTHQAWLLHRFPQISPSQYRQPAFFPLLALTR